MTDEPERARADPRARARAGDARRPARPRRARAQLPRDRARRARRPGRPAAAAREHRGGDRTRASTSTPRAATATSPSCSLRGGQLDELESCVADGLRFSRERGFWSHAYNLEVHRCVALIRRGGWDAALAGLRELVEGVDDPGMLHAYSVPWLGRLLARRGDPAAGGLLADGVGARPPPAAAARRRLRGSRLRRVGVAGRRRRRSPAGVAAVLLAAHRRIPGGAPFRGELLRYLARAGLAEPFAAARSRGRPACAATGARPPSVGPAGDPYERAVELVDSGDAGRRRSRARGSSTASARRRRRRSPASACGRWASACRAARAGTPRQPRRTHRAPARGAGAGERGADERRDRRPAGGLRAHRRPPRGRGAGQARRALAAGGGRRGARAWGSRSRLCSRRARSRRAAGPRCRRCRRPPVSIASVSSSPSVWETSSLTARPVTVDRAADHLLAGDLDVVVAARAGDLDPIRRAVAAGGDGVARPGWRRSRSTPAARRSPMRNTSGAAAARSCRTPRRRRCPSRCPGVAREAQPCAVRANRTSRRRCVPAEEHPRRGRRRRRRRRCRRPGAT